MISSQGCSWFFKKRTHPPLEQYITWTRTTQCPTVQTHTPYCIQKTKHTVSRWYRTAYIRWLVASYDTHKGKRWLNSEPSKPQGDLSLKWKVFINDESKVLYNSPCDSFALSMFKIACQFTCSLILKIYYTFIREHSVVDCQYILCKWWCSLRG